MHVTPLRHAATIAGFHGEFVAFEQRHPIERLAERSRGEQAAHARAEDDGVTTPHGAPPPDE
ncbi:hypothetical protein GCM10009555_082840 [Acrocarpospora macrocephala]|uniref:Uncharacterized protein n=1 Tax=Acrocarpospora macrocephala TaxID=150177 RepID=A0A5M3X5I5_9ACTN|nr:hypothetical protein [Acrocarpospora macrocephala]GES16374.1 hypothetical protein Amac_099720 [Acrocarpospora macrocephala]